MTEYWKLKAALEQAIIALNAAAGATLGIAMSGSRHPDPYGALEKVSKDCQAAITPAMDALKGEYDLVTFTRDEIDTILHEAFPSVRKEDLPDHVTLILDRGLPKAAPKPVPSVALEWMQVISGRWVAEGYAVERVYLDEYCWKITTAGAQRTVEGHLTFEAAKAAAQAHFDALSTSQ